MANHQPKPEVIILFGTSEYQMELQVVAQLLKRYLGWIGASGWLREEWKCVGIGIRRPGV